MPENQPQQPMYLNIDELMKDAKPCSVMEDVRKQMEAERPLIDPVALRRAQDWAYLRNQVVGAEVPREEWEKQQKTANYR